MDTLEKPNIYTVSQLNGEAKDVLEDTFGRVSVLGEISNLARPSSGHFYFTLKDEGAQVRCALFRMSRRKINFEIENGQQVLAEAQVSLYPGRGDFQLIVSNMQLAGAGALQVAFEKLKAKLLAEGLFDEDEKRELPEFPKHIGVITSDTGAALKDILKVLKRRCPSIPITVYPTMVQGKEAAAQIVSAIERANADAHCDVLIVARGGGSLEDLWPFNEEIVARAIFNSDIPTVSGVGHETDFTIADFVADHRAATPSAAAETVSPDQQELLQLLTHMQQRLTQLIQHQLTQLKQQLSHLQKRLRHPKDILQMQAQQLDQLEQRLKLSIKTRLQHSQEQLKSLSRALHTVSPLATLDRGYAILLKGDNDTVIRKTTDLTSGEKIRAKLSDGMLDLTLNDL